MNFSAFSMCAYEAIVVSLGGLIWQCNLNEKIVFDVNNFWVQVLLTLSKMNLRVGQKS